MQSAAASARALAGRLGPWLRRAARAQVLASVLVAAGCGGGADTGTVAPPQAQDGVLDLRAWDIRQDGMVPLDGSWQFVPCAFTRPDAPASAAAASGKAQPRVSMRMQVPAPWDAPRDGGAADAQVTAADAPTLNAHGFGTYLLRIDCIQARDLALSLPVQHSALRLFVNGREVASQGVPGDSASQSRAAPLQQLVQLDDQACPLRVVAHVSNYDIRRGGLVRSMTLGTRTQLHERREAGLVRDLFVMGALAAVGLMPILFFLARPRERSPLYFGLFCLGFALYLGLAGERALQPLVAPLGWNAYVKLVFLSWCLTQVLYALFVSLQYPALFPRWLLGAILAWGAGASAAVLVLPAAVFTEGLTALQAGALVILVCMFTVLVRATWQGRSGAALQLAGLIVLAAAVLHDAIHFAHLLTRSLVPWGVLAFVTGPAVLLARRFSRALSAEELRHVEQRERADLVVRATQAGVLDWDAAAGTLAYSPRLLEMLGYPQATPAAQLRDFYDLIHPDDRDAARALFVAQLRDRGERNAVRSFQALDYRLRRFGGGWLWVHAEGIGLSGGDGRTLRVICSFIDISAAKRHEAEMLASEQALADRVKFINDLVDSLPLALSMRSPDGRYVFANRAWERHHGLGRDDVIGKTLQDGLTAAEFAAERALDSHALALGPDTPLYTDNLAFRGGQYSQMRTVMTNARHEPVGVVTASEDVSSRRATERALATEQRRLGLVVRAARVGIVDWDGHTHETWYSPRFREIRGYPADADTTDWPDYFKVMIHPDDRGWVTRRWVAFIQGKGPEGPRGDYYSPEEYRMLRADGSHAWVLVSGMAVRDVNGFVVRWIAAVIETTGRRAQEEALRASRDQIAAQAAQMELQNEALKENVRLREEVERIGRHDIKTPLNSIIAVPRLLREERELTDDEDDLLGIVERAGYRILSMVNLSLDLYKMENGSYIFRPDAVDLADLAGKVIADLRSHAASRGVRIDVLQAPGTPAYAWAEELLCYSLIANLLKNAVEASPENGIVTVTLMHDAGRESVVMDIHNMGAVPEAIRGSFFQKYATAGKSGGTGLGAYSAQLMARVQDGGVAMHTSEAAGTTMSVRLKAAPAGTVPVTARHAVERSRGAVLRQAPLPPLDVLLVDDDEYNLLIVKRYLPSPPLNVQTAVNGRIGLEMARAHWPDVIFMDLDMPVMGGMEAVGLLREHERAAGCKRCRILALSSHDDAATQEAAIAAGFDQYLTKPVTRQVVQAVLARMAGELSEDGEPPPGGTGGWGAPGMQAAAGLDAAASGANDVVIDPELLPMIGGFIASRQQLIDSLAQAARDGVRPAIQRLAHQLAGSLALYGFHWAAARSRALEAAAGEVDLAAAEAQAGALRAHLARVAGGMEAPPP